MYLLICCAGSSLRRRRSSVEVPRLYCGTGPGARGLHRVLHGFTCSKACGILSLWPRSAPVSPALQGEVLTTGSPGKSHLRAVLTRLMDEQVTEWMNERTRGSSFWPTPLQSWTIPAPSVPSRHQSSTLMGAEPRELLPSPPITPCASRSCRPVPRWWAVLCGALLFRVSCSAVLHRFICLCDLRLWGTSNEMKRKWWNKVDNTIF